MAGTNLCEATACTLTLDDIYANTVTTPTVVEIVPLSDSVAVFDGPEFVLVTDGASPVIPEVRLYAVGSLGSPPNATVAASFGLKHIGSAETVAVLTAAATHCDAGWGAVVDSAAGTTALTCEPCPVGTFSAEPSWAACTGCPPETTTTVPMSETCEWCAAGFGWNPGSSACEACPVDTFSNAPTLNIACEPCPGSATTNGTVGATECTTPLVCLPGNGSVVVGGERACAPCPGGTFNANTTVEACGICPDGSTTEPGAIGATACDWCAEGFGLDTADGVCVLCGNGTYASNATLGSNCTACNGEVQLVGGLPLLCAEVGGSCLV